MNIKNKLLYLVLHINQLDSAITMNCNTKQQPQMIQTFEIDNPDNINLILPQ